MITTDETIGLVGEFTPHSCRDAELTHKRHDVNICVLKDLGGIVNLTQCSGFVLSYVGKERLGQFRWCKQFFKI